jgi:hypothetical protein
MRQRLVPELAIVFVGCQRGMRLAISSTLELGSRLRDGAASAVNRIVFLTGAIVRYPADDFLWIVTPSEGAFRIRPVMFRLAHLPWSSRA